MRNFNWNSELRFQFKRKRNSPTPYKSNIDVFGFFIDCGIQNFCKIINISLLFFVGPCVNAIWSIESLHHLYVYEESV